MCWGILRMLFVAATAACGRLAFDPVSDGPAGEGPPALSCPTTCGPTGTSACCESPVVPGGTFFRSYDGVGHDDSGYPATVSAFRLDKYEVTVGRFRQFVNAGMGTQQNPPASGAGGRTLNGMPNQGGWDLAWNANLSLVIGALIASLKCDATNQTWTDTPGGNENRPINCVNWYEAMAFCVGDGGFLPTEAEWNYAASGGSEQRAYPWSSPAFSLTLDDSTYASYYVDATKQCMGDGVMGCAMTDLVAVGTKPAGDGVWGHSDLGGNVWEWVLDWYATPYPTTSCNDCANLTPASLRVFRGGGFGDVADYLRTGHRSVGVATDRSSGLAFRCARTFQ